MKTKVLITIWSVLLFSCSLQAQHLSYPVSEIPEELLKNADGIIRLDEKKFEVLDNKTAKAKIKFVATILNKKANDLAKLNIPYDDNSSVWYIKGFLYNARGEMIKRLKNADIEDEAVYQYGNMYTDARYKSMNLYHYEYPYTIEFEYTVSYKDMVFYPNFIFQPDPNISVQHAALEIEIPREMDFRYRQRNLQGKVDSFFTKNKKVITWREDMLPARHWEVFAPPFPYVSPALWVTANEVHFDKYKGSITTWNDFGQWINQLNAGREDLPEEVKHLVNHLVKDCHTNLEKAKKIYQYVQDNTRYVNISLGIGGYQPSTTSKVHETGYGDCKGLTLYTKELLNMAGVEAYYSLVKSGSGRYGFFESMPSFQFNHVILNVPLEHDTVWLECTSQTIPFGFLGSHADNRPALVVTDEGGRLERTTAYKTTDNIRKMEAFVDILGSGNAEADIDFHFKGLKYDEIGFYELMETSQKFQREFLYDYISIPSFKINEIEFSEKRSNVPEATIHLEMDLQSFVAKSKDRLFFSPNLVLKWTHVPPVDSNRVLPVYVRNSYQDSIQVTYRLPLGYKIEYLPDGQEFNTEFGTYKAGYKKINNYKFEYSRSIKYNKGMYAKEKYDEFRDFKLKVLQADKEKVVLIDEEMADMH